MTRWSFGEEGAEADRWRERRQRVQADNSTLGGRAWLEERDPGVQVAGAVARRRYFSDAVKEHLPGRGCG